MAGGLLNLVAYGNANIILSGNPTKTFFKCTYAKYTNFGLQKFRLDYEGQRTISMTDTTNFKFKVKRYADLLMDTYLVLTLPTIWSPTIPPSCDSSNNWRPYRFQWIGGMGPLLIERVRFTVGGQLIQQFSGQYLFNQIERDFSQQKKFLYYRMTGNTPELTGPATWGNNNGNYPTAYFNTTRAGPDPSIRGRKIYIPLNTWFTLAAQMAFPLVSLQYNELEIDIDIRPVSEWFTIRNGSKSGESEPGGADTFDGQDYAPDFNEALDQFYRFIQPPPDISLNTTTSYSDKRTNWNADIHLMTTYGFLTDDEVRVFAQKEQKYLIKEVHEYNFENITGPQRVVVPTMGLVANWMWMFQRDDVQLRNQWKNYSKWPYGDKPYGLAIPTDTAVNPYYDGLGDCAPPGNINLWPGQTSFDTGGAPVTPTFTSANNRDIMTNWGLLLDGKYRENYLDAGIPQYIEKWVRTSGGYGYRDEPQYTGEGAAYCYNFCLNTDPFEFQPTGAMNLSKFNNIEFEINVDPPPLDPSAQVQTICDPSGRIIGINKPNWRIYKYTYNLLILEERYNVLTFSSGNAGLMYAR
tara:strand:+ start:4421 stop:6154 length:1734 start_codon:yes stop_codon:yes gene_type:complete